MTGSNTPLVSVDGLVKHFRLPGGWLSGGARYVHAVDGVDLEIRRGEVFGLVGEFGLWQDYPGPRCCS